MHRKAYVIKSNEDMITVKSYVYDFICHYAPNPLTFVSITYVILNCENSTNKRKYDIFRDIIACIR